MGDSPRGRTSPCLPSVGRMLTLTQIYAEAWSQLDPELADLVVASIPEPRPPTPPVGIPVPGYIPAHERTDRSSAGGGSGRRPT
jgi:hypothetical protein